jgi:uncharacterized protein YqjF (DUF2071 family)
MTDSELSSTKVIESRSRTKVTGSFTINTVLEHFALITYAIPPERVRHLIHPAFDLRTFVIDGQPKALLSVVPFLDRDFGFQHIPSPRFSFGQTNYRIYVRYQGEECAWFLGTTLASPLVAVPRNIWRLPWYSAKTAFDTTYNSSERRYSRYQVRTESDWGAANVTLADTGAAVPILPGFADMPTQQLVLTHPTAGYFWRTNQKLGTYRIWHDRMELTVGSVIAARFALLERLKIVSSEEMLEPHSVLIQPEIPFLVGVPPRDVELRRN